jgi:hypothetical protein
MKPVGPKKFFDIIIRSGGKGPDLGLGPTSELEVVEIPSLKGSFFSLSPLSYKHKLQSILYDKFLSRVELNDAAKAFRKDFCYLNFLEPHLGSYNFARFDIRNFFHSICIDRLKEVLSSYFSDDYVEKSSKQTLLDAVIEIITYRVPEGANDRNVAGRRILPVGFKTSPAISNIYFRQIDILIQKFCSRRNIRYTRYADDMLFSSAMGDNVIFSDFFEKELRVLLSVGGLKINSSKTIKAKNTISINGYVLQHGGHTVFDSKPSEIRVSKKKLDVICKFVYLVNRSPAACHSSLKKVFGYKIETKFPGKTLSSKRREYMARVQARNKLAGYRSYLIHLKKFGLQFQCTSDEVLRKYGRMILEIENAYSRIP